MYRKIIYPLLLILLIQVASVKVNAQEKTGQPVDIVFCLDLSSSANGLIDRLRNHIWDYWYFLSRCDPQPDYRIGIVAYSRFSYGKQSGYTRVIQDLTMDFETMSSILYKIPSRIEKGDQFVGSALNTCVKKISWSKNPNALKVIFLVGNGDIKLGPDDIDLSVKKLNAQNIIVNTIYCTVPGERRAIRGWQRLADLCNGKMEVMSIRTRYFDRLGQFDLQKFRYLNRKFNTTYLPYGQGGIRRWRMLNDEDNHVFITNTEGYRYRALYKISEDYQRKNYNWDMVDMYYKNPVAFMNVERKLLNDSCKKLTQDELKAYIIYKKYERKKLSAQIADMIAEKELRDRIDGKISEKTMPTLDIISIRMIKDLLKARGVECPTN